MTKYESSNPKYPDCTAAQAIAWLRAGDPESETQAIACLYSRMLEKFRPWVFSKNGTNADAHDAISDALYQFIDQYRAGRYREEGKMEHLLFRIAQRRFFDGKKSRGHDFSEDADWLKLVSENEDKDYFEQIEQEKTNALMVEKLSACLDKIGERCKERIMLFWYQNQSHKEIAEAMGDSSTNVSKVMMSKCKDKLEDCLKAERK